jgi:plasmid stability protein
MKTTIDLPDDLLIEVKIEAARQHKKLKELVPDLVRAGLKVRRTPAAAESRAMVRWLEEWVKLGEGATKNLPVGPTATEILASDRGRLERR